LTTWGETDLFHCRTRNSYLYYKLADELARALLSFKRPLLSVDVMVGKASNDILSNRANFMPPMRAIHFLFMLTSWKVPNFCRGLLKFESRVSSI